MQDELNRSTLTQLQSLQHFFIYCHGIPSRFLSIWMGTGLVLLPEEQNWFKYCSPVLLMTVVAMARVVEVALAAVGVATAKAPVAVATAEAPVAVATAEAPAAVAAT